MSLGVNDRYFSNLNNASDLNNVYDKEIDKKANDLFKKIYSNNRLLNDDYQYFMYLNEEVDGFVRLVNTLGLTSISNADALKTLNNIDNAIDQVYKKPDLKESLYSAQHKILLHLKLDSDFSIDEQIRRVDNEIKKEQNNALKLDQEFADKIKEENKIRNKRLLAGAGFIVGFYSVFVSALLLVLIPPIGAIISGLSFTSMVASGAYLLSTEKTSPQIMYRENLSLDKMRIMQKGKEAMNDPDFKDFSVRFQFAKIKDDQIPSFFEFFFTHKKMQDLINKKYELEKENFSSNKAEIAQVQKKIVELEKIINNKGFLYYFPTL